MSIQSVSIVVPARNEEDFLPACLESVSLQELEIPKEIIVVDNNSSDKTAKVAKDKKAKVINEKKAGLHFARQAGLEGAKGDLLVYLDADSRMPPDWLSTVVKYFDKHPEVVAASCNFVFFDGKFLEETGRRIMQRILIPTIHIFLRISGRPDFIFGSSMIVRRKKLEKIGGIDLSVPFYGEDINLSLRMNKVGKVRLIDDIFVYTSARRYHRQGVINTFAKYALSLFFLEVGLTSWARVIARKQ